MSHPVSRRSILAGAVSALSVGRARAEGAPIFAHIFGVDHPLHRWATWAADELLHRSDGRIALTVIPDGRAGREADLQRGMDEGTIAFTFAGFGQLGAVYQPISLLGAAYVFDGPSHWMTVMSSPLFAELATSVDRAGGHRVLSALYYGERHLTTRFRVGAPADVRGLRVRVPPASPLIQTLFPALGARAVVSPYVEIVETLRLGIVDAQENPLPTVLSLGIHELTPFINMTGHIVDGQVILAARPYWKRASAQDRELFGQVMTEAAAGAGREIMTAERDIALNLVYSGSIINPVDREPFREKFRDLYRSRSMPWSPDLLDRVLATR